MAHYVKFMRGTPSAYDALKVKNEDTLYFIYEQDQAEAMLFLGNKLIAGGDADFSVTSIDALKDVLLTENITDQSLLVYDATAGLWVNKSLEEAISVFIGASNSSAGLSGLVPAPPKGQTNLFLRSDGTWAAVSGNGSSISHNILSIENSSNKDHLDIIDWLIADIILTEGDVIIIKDIIANNKYQYTSYVYDGMTWRAMDGNYNAKSIYFDTDFIFTENVGTVKIPEGKGCVTVEAAGKNAKEFLSELFANDKNPTIKQPTISLSLGYNTLEEVGATVVPTYDIVFSPGSYEFGPSTDVAITDIQVSDSTGKIQNTLQGSFEPVTITENTDYTITAKITHSDGTIPFTALENLDKNGQITAKTLLKVSNSLAGQRKIFYGALNEKAEFTSATIRELEYNIFTLTDEISIPIQASTQRVVIALPEERDNIKAILDANAMNVNIYNSWKTIVLPVEGANGYDAIPYKIYYLDFAAAYGTTNNYIIQPNSET